MAFDWAALGTSEKEMEDSLSKAKIKLFNKPCAVFLSTLLGQTAFIWDQNCDTAWTDGKTIGFSPSFWLTLDIQSRVTVIAHELWHIAYQHILRINGRNPKKWNFAGDHVINLLLEKHGYSFVGLEFTLKNPKFMGMGTDEVYTLLPDPPPSGGGAKGQLIPLTDDVRPAPAEAQVEVLAKVVQAAQNSRIAGEDAGSIPGEITLGLDKFLNPKLPWEVLLHRFFTERSKDDFSWKRPNRRYEDIYLPGVLADNGLTKINYYLDISGSISDGDILRFNSEVASVKREFNPDFFNLITFDTQICDEYTFTEFEDFEKIVVTGRGGTDLYPVQQHILKHRPEVAVIFSDMYVPPMGSVGDIPVLWIVVGNPGATVPFGKMIHIDME